MRRSTITVSGVAGGGRVTTGSGFGIEMVRTGVLSVTGIEVFLDRSSTGSGGSAVVFTGLGCSKNL